MLRKGKYVNRWFWNDQQVPGPVRQCKVVKVVLTVAHLDHDAHNHLVKIDRLRDWCQRCHLQYDAQHKSEKKKAEKDGKFLGYKKKSNGNSNLDST
jgi:hypothetical protein